MYTLEIETCPWRAKISTREHFFSLARNLICTKICTIRVHHRLITWSLDFHVINPWIDLQLSVIVIFYVPFVFTCHLNLFHSPVRNYTQAWANCVLSISEVHMEGRPLKRAQFIGRTKFCLLRKKKQLDLQI